jgi:hypothetical protein
VLTRNSITFGQSTSALTKLRSLHRFLSNDYLMLCLRSDQSPSNGTFPCLIATIHDVYREFSIVNSLTVAVGVLNPASCHLQVVILVIVVFGGRIAKIIESRVFSTD